MDIKEALDLFGLTEQDLNDPSILERLEQKRKGLLTTWHPHRYANLTNNPRKYMKLYKQGEAKTKEINEAYQLCMAQCRLSVENRVDKLS
jgi:hypothetical protein